MKDDEGIKTEGRNKDEWMDGHNETGKIIKNRTRTNKEGKGGNRKRSREKGEIAMEQKRKRGRWEKGK